ncbi:MAG: hypothetical protein GY832_29000 [Chloroflexi bacterium]|nr:hypothetical protein [Chloroflexota bacterium]
MKTITTSISVVAITFLLLAGIGTRAQADTGVSDERVVLPDGPGSIGGVGENADIDPNMGLMRYQVPLDLPAGHAGMTPKLALSYASGNGASVAGIGWNFSVPFIERMSLRGLPEYTTDDEFAVNGSDELIEVGTDGGASVFRNRYEKSFVRYKWHEAGTGEAGYWTAEYPDGTVGYFGADSTGDAVDNARVTGEDGRVFRYHLVVTTDPFGHHIDHTYTKDGFASLIDKIEYVHATDGTARYAVQFNYEDRQDAISNCAPGFNLLETQRMASVEISSSGTVMRKYVLSYEDYATSGGTTRLAGVKQYGLEDRLHAINFSFAYSKSLGVACESDCEKPFMVEMGTLPGGVNISTGRATLLDINGDALPDVLSTSQVGEHQFYISELDASGNPGFTDQIVESASTTGGSPFILNAPGVQVLDVNGDGFTDVISSRTGAVLCNTGAGDWEGTDCLANSTLPQMEEDAEGDANPLHVRFFDYDNDKRIDMMRTNVGSTEVYSNTGTAFEAHIVEDIGAVFDESRLQLADMNGDGLQDPVEMLIGGQIRYRLNLGFGTWAPWTTVDLEGIDDTAQLAAQLEDINGDGLADVVVVLANEISYALNRNADRFDDFLTITSDDVEGDIPEKTSETTVLFADMNGNGSRDITWVTSNGNVKFLEIFPVKPNLLSRIENGIGHVQTIEYGASVVEQARDRDNDPWMYKLPHAMNVVVAQDSWVTLTGGEDGQGLHERVEYKYHHGFYDGGEKTFRGYNQVDRIMIADSELDSQESGLDNLHYDVGASDPYYNGLLLWKQTYSGVEGDLTELQREEIEYGECSVAEVPSSGLRLPVRYICQTARQVVHQEGASETDWATTRAERSYDGYGNITYNADLGVLNMGSPDNPSSCPTCEESDNFGAPCGTQCTGDEHFSETDYVVPGKDTSSAWIINLPYNQASYGVDGGPRTEIKTYYDGEAFEGLALGKLTAGLVSATTKRISESSDEVVYTTRSAFDEHGNVIKSIDPNGSPAMTTAHRRSYTYDDWSLKPIRVEIFNEDAASNPYILRRDVAHDDIFHKINQASNWQIVQGGSVTSQTQTMTWTYDEFGRALRTVLPGDSEQAPSREYTYDVKDPASRILVKGRSEVGGALDLEQIRCIDGRGRIFQKRTKLESGLYQVTGFSVFNKRGAKVRVFQPYQSNSAECDSEPPEDVLYTSYSYDAVNRLVQSTVSDEDIHGTASVWSTVYTPLTALRYDPEDNDPTSTAYNTPVMEKMDGLGRLVEIERYLTDFDGTGESAGLTVHYDSLGNMAGHTDAAGFRHTQTFDLLGRVASVDAPNSGLTAFKYDAAGNRTEVTDARNMTTKTEYDGLNRKVAQYSTADPENTRSTWEYDFSDDCETCTNAQGNIARITYPLGADRGTGIDEFGYNERGQKSLHARTLEGHRFETGFSYDDAQRLSNIVLPDGESYEYTYDAASRLTGITGILFDVTYDKRSLLESIVYIEGSSSTRTYDSRMSLSSLSATSSDGTVLQGATFTRNRLGDLKQISDIAGPREDRPSWNAEYTHDPWYRVVEASLDPGGDAAETLSYSYDHIDNVLSRTSSLGNASKAHIGGFTYDDDRPNAVATAGDTSYEYDAAGAMISRGNGIYTRDFLGRLTTSSTAEDGVVGEYVYGPNQARVMKLEGGGVVYYINNDYEVRDGIGTSYARLGRNRIARSQTADLMTTIYEDLAPLGNGDGKITAADAWLAHASEEGIMAGGALADADAGRMLRAAARRMLFEDRDPLVFFHHDHLGSLTMATNGYGEVVGEVAFYPEGQVRYSGAYVDDYGFTGQEFDQSSGLIHFAYRDLDPHSGRWASADPAYLIASKGNITHMGESSTAYAYVANNPINTADPYGLGPKLQATKRVATKIKKKTTGWKTKIGMGVGKVGVGIGLMAAGDLIGGAMKIVAGGVGMSVGSLSGAFKAAGITKSNLTKGLQIAGTVVGVAAIAVGIAVLSGVTMGVAPLVIGAVAGGIALARLGSQVHDAGGVKATYHILKTLAQPPAPPVGATFATMAAQQTGTQAQSYKGRHGSVSSTVGLDVANPRSNSVSYSDSEVP